MTTALVDLRGRGQWAPVSVLAPPAGQLWPEHAETIDLGAVTELIVDKSAPPVDDVAVVAPPVVNSDTGEITATRRHTHGEVRAFGPYGLRAGDLLVPPSSDQHVLLLADNHAGFVFSTAYLALRPSDEVDPLWLWAVLNSLSGRAVRRAAQLGSRATNLSASGLLNIPIPAQRDSWRILRPLVEELHQHSTASTNTREVGQSWWRMTTLPRNARWNLYLATRTPERFEDGVALAQLVDQFRTGVRIETISEEPREGWIPYLTVSDLRAGRKPSGWVADQRVMAEPGDLLVADAGQRGPAVVADELLVPGSGILIARFGAPELATRVAGYLNSAPGQTVRSLLVNGTAIPHLGLRGLQLFPIPEDTLAARAATTPAPSEPLPSVLDRLLWT